MKPRIQAATEPRSLRDIRRVIVKVGSKLLADSPAGRPAQIADELAQLRQRGTEVVVVSSGAIALGLRKMGIAKRPTTLPLLQAAAAVGQGQLLQHWEHGFSAHGVGIGQVLLTHADIADRRRFLNARHALRALLEIGVVPIINENDTVAVEEIKYGDNDMLAALVCNLVSAHALLLLTDVEGLRGKGGKRIPRVRNIEREAMPFAGGPKQGGFGSGGMASKVQAAKVASRSGACTLILPGRVPGVIGKALAGDDVGTLFAPEDNRINSRKHWIAYGRLPRGVIAVDEGAFHALTRGGRSLLPAGIERVEGDFDLGDLVSLVNHQNHEFARGLAGYRAHDLRQIRGLHSADIKSTLGYKYLDEVIHRDDLVLL